MMRFFYPLVVVTFTLGLLLLCLVFMVVPNEKTMGAVQRLFYFHVGCAIASYLSMVVILYGSVAYLRRRKPVFDALTESGGEVGFLFSTIVLGTGMIWGHAAWNTWFRWEPRLVTFLLLWLVFIAFIVLRRFGDPVRIAAHSAILGVIGSVMVPIVVLSVRLLPGVAQLHPVLQSDIGMAPEMRPAFFVGMITLVMLQILLLWLRTRIGIVERRLELEGGY